MELKQFLRPGEPQGQQRAVTPVRTKEQVAFSCRLCGNCCRNVEDTIMLEPLDAYSLACCLRGRSGVVENIEDVYSKYAHPTMLERGYPIFLLNTQGGDHACVFLKDGRCSVYAARPRVCRLYPFTVETGQRGRRFAYYQCLDRHTDHFEGGKVNIGDWMYQNFTREAREFLEAEAAVLPEFRKLLTELGPEGRRHCLLQILYYRYYNYELDQPFLPQYRENQRLLLESLRKVV